MLVNWLRLASSVTKLGWNLGASLEPVARWVDDDEVTSESGMPSSSLLRRFSRSRRLRYTLEPIATVMSVEKGTVAGLSAGLGLLSASKVRTTYFSFQ